MTYLTRPVFEFDVDWSNTPTKSLQFDLRETSLGFGAEFFAALQQHVVQGYSLRVTLNGAAELAAFDEFFEDLTGRLQGFWLPTPFEAVQIVTADDASHFYIRDQNLRGTFADQPDLYLLISRAGAVRAAKIANVAAASEGRERVTLTAGLGTPATPADVVHRLHYVRLLQDVEQGEFYNEGVQERELVVVELPHEYEAFETGESPIWLYHLWADLPAAVHWRYTSFAANVVSDNLLYTNFPMEHRSLTRSVNLGEETLDIAAKYDAAHPFALFLPFPLSKPMNIEVFKVTLADPETREKIFTGKVRVVTDEGDKVVARCDAWSAMLKRKVPVMLIGKDCPHVIFDPNTCKLERFTLETTGTIASVDDDARPPVVVLDLDNPDSAQAVNWLSADWFAGGHVERGFGIAYRVRGIVSSANVAGQLSLELNAPLGAAVGEQIALIPDCGGQAAKCKAFGNFSHYGGCLAVPDKNPSLKASAPVSQGGKK